MARKGNLFVKALSPSRPIYFLNDEGNERMINAYFKQFKGVWHHGDFITITKSGSVIVHGRSDATLNPVGCGLERPKFIGRQSFFLTLDDSICVGKTVDGDVQVMLYVKMSSASN